MIEVYLIHSSAKEQSQDDRSIFFCYQNRCVKISAAGTLAFPGLANEYEEADYMFVAYPVIEEGNIMIRSPSGDVDIIAMLVGHMDKISATVYIDNGTGKSRKVFKLISCTLSPENAILLWGCMLIPGNNYVSGFFRKGKKTFWRVACKNVKFLSALSSLRTSYQINNELEETLEKYVCAVYGKSKPSKFNNILGSL